MRVQLDAPSVAGARLSAAPITAPSSPSSFAPLPAQAMQALVDAAAGAPLQMQFYTVRAARGEQRASRA